MVCRFWWGALLAAILLAAGSTRIGAATAGGSVAVIVARSLPVDNLRLSDLRNILLGERQFWPGGARVTILMRDPGAHSRDVILRKIYQMSEAQYRQYWIAKVFRAEAATAPKVVYSDRSATDLVAGIPGAVAFIDANQAPHSVKVLRIDGHLPDEAGYPL